MYGIFNGYVLAIGLILWGLQYLLAYDLNCLTAFQMRDIFPTHRILPLAWHGGIWFDLPLTFWLAYLVEQHPEWTEWDWTGTLFVGFVASWLMHFYMYAPATLPNPDPSVVVTQEAHVQNGGLTSVGFVRMVFFGMAFAILLNEALFSHDPPSWELWTTAVIVIALMIVGNHMVLGVLKEFDAWAVFEYRGDPLRSIPGWATVGGVASVTISICIARCTYYLW